MPQQPPKPREPSAAQLLADCASFSLVTARDYVARCTPDEAEALLELDRRRIAGDGQVGDDLRPLLDQIADRMNPPPPDPAAEASPDDDTELLTSDS